MLLGAMSIVFFAMRILPGRPVRGHDGRPGDHRGARGLHQEPRAAAGRWRSSTPTTSGGRCSSTSATRFRQGYPVSEYIARMFPHTLVLVVASAVVAALIGIPIGIISALKRRNPLIDYPLRIFALLGLSMPVFWLGILLLIVFSLHLDIFPLIGGGDLDGVLAMIRSGEVFTEPARLPRRGGRRPPPPGPARARARLHAGRHGQPALALGHAGGDQPGLHPHRARQGPGRARWSSTSTRSAT